MPERLCLIEVSQGTNLSLSYREGCDCLRRDFHLPTSLGKERMRDESSVYFSGRPYMTRRQKGSGSCSSSLISCLNISGA